MGILQRFKDIMASNINALLDKAEDPEKMIDQTLRNLTKDLAEVKKETAAVMADEQRCKRELDEVNSEITKMQAYAEKALLAGNEADAMKFLEKKNQLSTKRTSLQQSYDMAVGNAVGSNIFNILMVLGIASAINPVSLIRENVIDIIILVAFSVVVWIFAATKKKISRKEGIAMVAMYLVYAVYIILR